jgi:hypothetical protein
MNLEFEEYDNTDEFLEFEEYANTYEFLDKWRDLIENGVQPHDIRINGLGLFTNARIIVNGEHSYTLTYDEYFKEPEE